MSHLGSRLSALVDGQLAPSVVERTLAHVAGCPPCAAELSAARAARRALVCADDVVPTSDLTARLLLLAADSHPVPPGRGEDPFSSPWVRGTSGGDALLGAGRGLPTYALTGDVSRHPLRRRTVASFAGVGAVAIALFVMGDSPPVVPSDEPAHALAMLGRAAPPPLVRTSVATGSVGGASVSIVAAPDDAIPATDSLAWVREHGWTSPAALPDGWTVTSVRFVEEDVLEIDLVGWGASIVVTERHGRLDTDALADVEQVELGHRVVHVLSTDPWHAAWQSGDTVVEVVAAGPSGAVATLVAGFPAAEYDGGVPARITRGWGTVTQAIQQP